MDDRLTRRELLASATLTTATLALALWRHLHPPPEPAPGELPLVRVDLNRAPRAELLALPGIGPVSAGRLIQARPIQTTAELVALVGPARAAALRPHLAPLPGDPAGPDPAPGGEMGPR